MDHRNLRKGESYVSLLPELKLEEKINLLSGDGFFSTPGVPRLGIPALNVADSVNGVRPQPGAAIETVCFPSTTSLASTWNPQLMYRLGEQLADQARANNAHIILGPTINIHRDPRAGRNFECFSEDPLLSGLLGAAIVNGLQANGIGACPKHFVCNDSETDRRKYDVRESPNRRTLREIYLAAFQHLLRNSDPVALMTAYNKVDGASCSESPMLNGLLRKEWKYSGCVMSDWFGTISTVESINAGLDLEMPGPSIHRGKKLMQEIERGTVKEATIDAAVTNLLRLRDRIKFERSTSSEASSLAEHTNKFARELATEGTVLLKNAKDVLPLQLCSTTKIAVVGRAATTPVVTGGGSASNTPPYQQTPLDCLRIAHTNPDEVRYAEGVRTRVILPMAPKEILQAKDGKAGVDILYFNKGADKPILEEFQEQPMVDMLGFLKPGLHATDFHFEIHTRLTPTSTGLHTIAVRVTGAFELYVDGEMVLEGPSPNVNTEQYLFDPILRERQTQMQMVAQRAYTIRLITQAREPMKFEPTAHGAVLCFEEHQSDQDAIVEAIDIASKSDVTIIYAGRDGQYESEGFDLTTILLPDNQNEMIKAVAAASKRTVLVLHCGNPIDVSPFVDHVDAILNAHFPGQEGAQALVNILLGKTNPSGKLATTWFNNLNEVPSLNYFPAKAQGGSSEIKYMEGLNVGYRASDANSKTRWPLGYGLSYTSFDYSNIALVTLEGNLDESVLSSMIKCTVTVTNTGDRAGMEVVQLYVSPPTLTPVARPARELKAFAKVLLQPGESKEVDLEVRTKVACSYWDEQSRTWRLENGKYVVQIANLSAAFSVAQEAKWNGL